MKMRDDCFATSEVSVGQMKELIRNLMCQMSVDNPYDAIRSVNSWEWVACECAQPRREVDNAVPLEIDKVPIGELNGLVKNLMWQMFINDPSEAITRIISWKWVVSEHVQAWREENGIVYLSVTSDGTTGEDWISRLEKKDYLRSPFPGHKDVKRMLRSPNFKPTSGVTTEIAILTDELFADGEFNLAGIGVLAERRKLTKLNAEVACLIRDKFTDVDIEEMGLLWIITMHESFGKFGLFEVNAEYGTLGYCSPDEQTEVFSEDHGLAFAVSETQAKAAE